MIVGHAPLAVAVAGSVASSLGIDRRRALVLAALAGAFAVVPDVDMVYAVVGLVGSNATGVWGATEAFWESSKVIHRAVTHSLVLAVPAVVGFGLLADRRRRAVGAGVLAALPAVVVAVSGPLAGVMMALYIAAGTAVTAVAVRAGLGRRATLAVAGIGLLSHPFGDVFTGEPPQFLFPVGVRVASERVALVTDPTLNLLGVFALELAAVWIGVLVVIRLLEWSLVDLLDWHAVAGAGYGLAAFVIPAPTLDVSYHFVFSILAVGGVGATSLTERLDRRRLARAFVTGLSAVTLGGAAYLLAYLLA